jgi:hypothetical protein
MFTMLLFSLLEDDDPVTLLWKVVRQTHRRALKTAIVFRYIIHNIDT